MNSLLLAWRGGVVCSMKRKLERLKGVDEATLKKLASAHVLTVEDLLCRTQVEVVQLGLTQDDAKDLMRSASESVAPAYVTVSSIASGSTQHLPTTIAVLDDMLGGGIPARSVTEVVGPPGAGKTQFCHMMAVLGTFPVPMGGLDGKVLYIDTEGAFSPDRLYEIANHRSAEHLAEQVASSVLVQNVKTSTELMELLRQLETLIITHGVKLVILDSIAAVVRRQFDNSQIKDRQMLLGEAAQLLKQAAERYHLPVLVTNQVTGKFVAGAAQAAHTVTAALGAMWAHAVNTRLVLENRGASGGRHLFIAKSPRCPVCSLCYQITAVRACQWHAVSLSACYQVGLTTEDREMTVSDNYFGFGLIAHDDDE
jgi:RAD51-like protein 1